jgi:glycosyltransferase involved in cell wall biosynthesis
VPEPPIPPGAPVRIGFFDHTAQVSGAELSLLGLLEHLNAQAPDRYVPVLICPPGELAQRALARGIAVVPLPVPPFGFTRHPLRLLGYGLGIAHAAWRLGLLARQERLALIHANSVRAGLIACAAAPWHRLPVICHVRDVLPARALARLAFRLLRRADALIAISTAVAAAFAVDPVLQHKVRVIYNGVDVAALQAQAGAALLAQCLPAGAGPVLGVVGQLTPWKGQADAIAAFGCLAPAYPHAHLLIAGEAKFTHASARYDTLAYATALEAQAARLGLAGRVHFLGQQAHIATLLRRLDLLLVPSWEEPFGRVVIEALALGVPVLGTRAGGIPEILDAPVDLLVPPRDPAALAAGVDTLLHDPARRAAIARTGQERVRARFTLARHGAAMTALYARVLARRRPLLLFANHTGQVSGAEISLLGMLTQINRARFRVLVACPPCSPLAAHLATLGIAHIAWTPGGLGFARSPREALAAAGTVVTGAAGLRRIVRRVRPALLHANSIRTGLLAGAATLGLPVPLVVHVRDHLPPGGVSQAVRRVLHLRAALILGVSRDTVAEFRVGGPGHARYAVLHDGVDPKRFASAAVAGAAHLRTALGVDQAYPLLGVVGQLTPWKGHDDAIRALARLLPRYPAAHLLIVGEAKFTAPSARYDTGRYRRELEALAVDLGVAGRVHFTGERTDIPAVMAAIDVLLVPSWSEPFGIVMIEAMAAGTPVVATRGGGPADVITSGHDGVLVPPRDPAALAATLDTLLADPAALRAIGARARARVVSSFTVARQARRVERLYDWLLTPRRVERRVE